MNTLVFVLGEDGWELVRIKKNETQFSDEEILEHWGDWDWFERNGLEIRWSEKDGEREE